MRFWDLCGRSGTSCQSVQVHRGLAWIAWQSLFTVAARVLIFWLYNNAGRSLFSAVLFHAMIDVSVFSFPNYGSHYDPAIFATITAFAAGAVTLLWGSRTLAGYGFATRLKQASTW